MNGPDVKLVLVVDDDPGVRRVMERMLQRAGYGVEICTGFRHAEERLNAGLRADLLITDMVLGESSGKDVANLVRRHVPGIPVIYISGYNNIEVTRGEFVLQKPFAASELVSALAKVFEAGTADVLLSDPIQSVAPPESGVSGARQVIKPGALPLPGELPSALQGVRPRRPPR